MIKPTQEYKKINELVAGFFYSGRFSMQPAYLEIDDEAKIYFKKEAGIDPADVESEIGNAAFSSLSGAADPYLRQQQWLTQWLKSDRKNPPPFLALLASFSIAAERMGIDNSFGQNNYYERLFEVLEITDETLKQRLKTNAKSTRQLWRYLNIWLTENEYKLGRPTARPAISAWQYASFSLSQALIRAADRKRFSKMFEMFSLSPGDLISVAEMELMVHEWMTISTLNGPSNWLRRLWQTHDLRARIVSAALDALEVWDHAKTRDQLTTQSIKFSWYLSFNGFPKKQANFILAVSHGAIAEKIIQEPDSPKIETELFLQHYNSDAYHYLSPFQHVNLDQLLLFSAKFKGETSGHTYSYVAKPIIPFSLASDGYSFKEVTRVSLLDEHIILCHANWLDKVTTHLHQCGAKDYTVFEKTSLRGIPDNWKLIKGVKLLRCPSNVHENLSIITPITGGTTISILSGLKLGHGIWHKFSPPKIEVACDNKLLSMEIYRETFEESEARIGLDGPRRSLLKIDTRSIELRTADNLRIAIKENDREIAEGVFSVRDANTPRSLSQPCFAHELMGDQGFSAVICQSHDIKNKLEGAFFHGSYQIKTELTKTPDLINVKPVPDGISEEMPIGSWESLVGGKALAQESCVIRGYHYWIVEPFNRGDSRYQIKRSECKDCNSRAVSKAFTGGGFTASRGSQRMTTQRPVQPVAAVQAEATTHFEAGEVRACSADTFLDALHYLGTGTWGTFQRLASTITSEPFYAQELASLLFSLGQVEFENSCSFVGSRWSIPPGSLNTDADGNLRLSGFYCTDMLVDITERLKAFGCEYIPISTTNQLTIHRWEASNVDDVKTAIADITDPFGRHLKVFERIGDFIAENLPSIYQLLESAEPITIGSQDSLARFDIHKMRWVETTHITEAGAYRVGIHGVRYIYYDESGSAKDVGYRLSKILAAKLKGVNLHKYDSRTKNFISAIGADPPWLYARALACSSGRPPVLSDTHLVYEGVSPSVAKHVLEKIYSK